MKKEIHIVANVFIMAVFSFILISGCAPKQGQSASANLHKSSFVKKEMKPGAPVVLESPTLFNINANQSSNINIALKTSATSGNMHVDVIAGDGLQLFNKQTSHEIVLNGSSNYPLTAELMAPNNGRFYLNLHVTLDNGEDRSSRTLAVIIQVGPNTDKPSADESAQPNKLFKTSTDKDVISMPAQETVTHK